MAYLLQASARRWLPCLILNEAATYVALARANYIVFDLVNQESIRRYDIVAIMTAAIRAEIVLMLSQMMTGISSNSAVTANLARGAPKLYRTTIIPVLPPSAGQAVNISSLYYETLVRWTDTNGETKKFRNRSVLTHPADYKSPRRLPPMLNI